MCNCVSDINKKLEPHNYKILSALTISKDLSKIGSRMLVMVEKIDKKIRKPTPKVMMSFCPFCGDKLSDA